MHTLYPRSKARGCEIEASLSPREILFQTANRQTILRENKCLTRAAIPSSFPVIIPQQDRKPPFAWHQDELPSLTLGELQKHTRVFFPPSGVNSNK